jgi:hypothetical protein
MMRETTKSRLFMVQVGLCTCFWVGCGEDTLGVIPNPVFEPTCEDTPHAVECLACDTPELIIDGACVAPGTIEGRLCHHSKGTWLSGAAVTLTLNDGTTITTLSDAQGAFHMESLAPGGYYVNVSAEDYANQTYAVKVSSGGVTKIGDEQCLEVPGHISGALCDTVQGVWVQDASLSLNDENESTSTTDAFGSYIFYSVAPGTYTLTTILSDGSTSSQEVSVVSGETTEIGPSQCSGSAGSLSGRICGGEGYWLSNALLETQVGSDTAQTTTDADGYFTLNDLPAGTYTIKITKGSFETTFEVEIEANQPTVIEEPVCIPPTANLAVITGAYDNIEDVLTNLGHHVRNQYTTTTPLNVSTDGNIDIIDGQSSFWLESFLNDGAWLADYDIILFNCGMDDSGLLTSTSAANGLKNLHDFVAAGGSVYASDWAHGVIDQAFAGRIQFEPDSSMLGEARVGRANLSQAAQVVDGGLATALGQSDIVINLNLSYWVMMQTVSAQAGDVTVLLKGDVTKMGFIFDYQVADVPISVRFEQGMGRVLYTSAHNEGQNTPDLESVLNYFIYEL